MFHTTCIIYIYIYICILRKWLCMHNYKYIYIYISPKVGNVEIRGLYKVDIGKISLLISDMFWSPGNPMYPVFLRVTIVYNATHMRMRNRSKTRWNPKSMWILIKKLDQIGPMSNRPTTFIQKVLPQTRIQIQMEVKWWFSIFILRLPKYTPR